MKLYIYLIEKIKSKYYSFLAHKENIILRNRLKYLEKEKELKKIEEHKKKLLNFFSEYDKILQKSILSTKNLVYEEIRTNKINKNEIAVFKGFEIDIYKKFLGLISYKPKTPILYFGKNREILPIGLNTEPKLTIDLLEKQKYIINNDSKDMWFMKGKRTLLLTPDFPMNFDVNIKQNEILCDSDTLHELINNVVRYKLTQPVANTNIVSSIKKYWIIIVVMGVIYFLYQSGQLNKLFGI